MHCGRSAATHDFASTFDVVSKMRPPNVAVRKQLQKWLGDLQSLVARQGPGMRVQLLELNPRLLELNPRLSGPDPLVLVLVLVLVLKLEPEPEPELA